MTREEAIENLKELLECSYVDRFEDSENEALEMAIKALEQEKTGHWEIIPKDKWDSSTAPHIKCTRCNCRPFGDVPFAYCPNCGARMESKE